MQLIFSLLLITGLLSCTDDSAPDLNEVTSRAIESLSLEKKPVDNYSTKYDHLFKKATKHNFSLNMDYRWFKAQGVAESNLDPDAISSANAKGIMQIMDATAAEIMQNTGFEGSVFDARWSIMAGVYYDATLYNKWTLHRPELDKIALMLASYNAGFGNILKAQKVCLASGSNECHLWSSIKAQGHKVSSWKEKETLAYVTRIFKLMGYSENY